MKNPIGIGVEVNACTEVTRSRLRELKNVIASENIPDESLWKSDGIVIDRTSYKVGDFFILGVVHGDEIPLFVKVLYILKFQDQ